MSSRSNLGLVDLEKPYTCEFCHKNFSRESTLTSHSCEAKRRHQSQNQPEVKRALQAFQAFHQSLNPRSRVLRSFEEFLASGLYPIFVKFGSWSLENRVQEFPTLLDWLIRSGKKPQDWCDLNAYQEYLRDLLLSESSEQALKRSLGTLEAWSRDSAQPFSEFFRACNSNVIVSWITSGRISGWLLYNAPSALDFFERCNPEQLNLVQAAVPHLKWKILFSRNQVVADAIRDSLREAGL
jgi:hypothetical protein